jgi:hypothetical protein
MFVINTLEEVYFMIEILPETKENLLAVKATEKLTRKDYEEVFIPKLKQLIQEHGKVRAVVYLDDNFDGWEIGAMWDDAKFGIQHRNDFDKIALVSSKKWIEWATKIGAHFMKGQMKTFDGSQLQEALAWIKE